MTFPLSCHYKKECNTTVRIKCFQFLEAIPAIRSICMFVKIEHKRCRCYLPVSKQVGARNLKSIQKQNYCPYVILFDIQIVNCNY
jgi:hypothetical protein